YSAHPHHTRRWHWRDHTLLQRGGWNPAEAPAVSASGTVDRGLVYDAEGQYQRPEYVAVFLFHCQRTEQNARWHWRLHGRLVEHYRHRAAGAGDGARRDSRGPDDSGREAYA